MRPLLRAAAAIPPLALRGDYWAPVTLLPYLVNALRHAGPGVQVTGHVFLPDSRRAMQFFVCLGCSIVFPLGFQTALAQLLPKCVGRALKTVPCPGQGLDSILVWRLQARGAALRDVCSGFLVMQRYRPHVAFFFLVRVTPFSRSPAVLFARAGPARRIHGRPGGNRETG